MNVRIMGVIILFVVLITFLVLNESSRRMLNNWVVEEVVPDLQILGLMSETIPSPVPLPTFDEIPPLSPTLSPIPTENIKGAYTQNYDKTSLVECIGPDGKHFSTTQKQCDDLNQGWGKNSDYIVDCSIHINCGGGSRRIPKSQCDSFTCCTFQNGTSSFISKSDCSKPAPYTNNNNTYPKYVPPTWVPFPTFVPYATYTPSPTYSNPTPVIPANDPRCSQANNMWIEYRNDFLANKVNNYSNSAEAMIAYENEKQYIQNLINSYGCSLTLR